MRLISGRPSRIEDLALMRFHGPFFRLTFPAASAIAALVLLTPAMLTEGRAEMAQAAPSDNASATTGNVAAVDPATGSQQKILTSKAIDKVKEVAKSAGDILSRVPCRSPTGGG